MNKKLPKQVQFESKLYTWNPSTLQYECRESAGFSVMSEEFAKTSKLVKPVVTIEGNFKFVDYVKAVSNRPEVYAYDEPESNIFEKYQKYFYENSLRNNNLRNIGSTGGSIGVDVGIGRTQEKKPVEQPKIDTTNYPRIQIEKMLYGDFRVQVWDKQLNSMLDKEYFCRGFNSALQTAMSVKLEMDSFKDLPIYLYQDNKEKKLYD